MISKYIKKGLLLFAALPLMGAMFQGCSDKEAFSAATEDDSPRILNSDMQSVDKEGNLQAFPDITVDEKFEYEVVVTPVEYTTVDWYFDGVKLFTGKKIDMSLLAGDYVVRFVAKTTTGKETYRVRSLHVMPLASDPYLADDAKSRWITVGQQNTIAGGNLNGITKMYIGGANGQETTEVTDFANNGTDITFTLPESIQVEDSIGADLQITLANAEGKLFGCSKVHVSNEEYKEPGTQTVVLYDGNEPVHEWTCVDQISTGLMEMINAGTVKAGSVIKLTVQRTADDWASVVLINKSWQGILTGKLEPERGDIPLNDFDEKVLEIEMTEQSIGLIKDNDGGFYVTGHGFTFKKATVEIASGFDGLVFKGEIASPEWGPLYDGLNETVTGLVNNGSIKVGQTLTVKGTRTEADYCSIALVDQSWTSVIDGSVGNDRTVLNFAEVGEDQTASFEITQTTIDIIKAGGFYINGHGFVITKITVE